jgi:sec-independent protein translocase protein TatB
MFDFAWSEIALIGVVALIAIGPKDMPVAIRGISDTLKKLRRMAGEFQGHVDEMLREADLGDVKTSFDELRRMNPRSMVQRAIDPDGTVRSAFADPFRDHPVPPVMTKLDQAHVPDLPTHAPHPEGQAAAVAPAFIPPGAVPPPPPRAEPAPAFIPPAFIPPAFVPPAAAQDGH